MTETDNDTIEIAEQREERRLDDRDRTIRIAVAIALLAAVLIAFTWILIDYNGRVSRQKEAAAVTALAKKKDDEAKAAATAKASQPATQTKVATATAPPVQYLTVVQDQLRMRESPDGSANTVQKLPTGVKLRIMGQQSGWYYVMTANNVKGWVRSGADYVKRVGQ